MPKARAKRRHIVLFFSFWALVVGPIAVTAWYLYTQAADQYASRSGFAVRSQDPIAPIELFQGLGSMSGTQNPDADILYEFIQSQEMVEMVDATLGLRTLFSKPANDPVFALDPTVPIEGLVDYWNTMVDIFYDSTTGLIELRVKAFEPADATAISQEVLAQSSTMINRLSAIAREDTTRYAQGELDDAITRLKKARQALTAFRSSSQIVDPSADVQGQMTVLISLQQQLAETYIELDLLVQTSRDGDPRVVNLQREVDVIEKRIEIERKKFGIGGADDATYSTVVARFEELNVDLEFAQAAYLSALTSYDTALREAQHQSRYLAAYLNPTRPQSAEFPQRIVLLGIVSLFLFLFWSVLTLVYYSLRDRS
ncbi:MAG: sugar transporter [Paracoccaceae bacterium]